MLRFYGLVSGQEGGPRGLGNGGRRNEHEIVNAKSVVEIE
jgi:hypothetical protein